MKNILTLFFIASVVAPALSQAVSSTQEPCMQIRTSFDFVVHAPYALTAPLFGPDGERAWAGKHWDPVFIHPLPAKDVEGAVFTVRHGTFNAVWVNTLFDIEGHHFQYVYFLPDLMVTLIDVRFNSVDANATAVDVTYTRTAITPQGNEHVLAMSEGDKAAGKDWQQAIQDYLARSRPTPKP